MKTFLYATAACISLSCAAFAFDAGPSLDLERYTVLTNGALLHEDGNMLSNGRFRVLDSEIYDSLEIDPAADYEAISGRPICVEEAYDTYKSSRIVPHWVRSRDDFGIGYFTYVIVAIAGQDANPTIRITAQPQSQNVLAGQFALFSVTASPSEYISCQWLFNGHPIKGATGFLLFIGNISPKQAGIYSAVLNDGGRNVSSARAALRVVTPVSITTNPKSQAVKMNHAVVFRVAAKGTGPFSYQWYFDETPIPKATKSFYTVSKAKVSDAGRYGVVVKNSLSSAATTEAILAVNP
jgi:hypothetical protein